MNWSPNRTNIGYAVVGFIIGYFISGVRSGCPPDPVECQKVAIISLLLFAGSLTILGYIVGSVISKK